MTMRLRVPKTLRRLVSLLLLAAVIEYLVLPQVAGARKSVHLLSDANVYLVLLGVVLEGASLWAYACLTFSVLPAPPEGPRLTLWRVFRMDLATLSVSHVVPGGTAAGASLGYRLITAAGVPGAETGFALALQGIGSAVVLNGLLWLGLIASIPLYGFNALYGTAAVLGVLLIAFVVVVVVLMTRGEERAVRLLRGAARRIPLVRADQVEGLFRRLAAHLQDLAADRARLARCVGWAAANWVLDATSLWVFLLAFGRVANPDGLIVAYGLANVLAAIPITPGGLGVVEGVLVPALVGFGTPRGVAILGVLAWRLVNFWLPIPAGAGAYLSLRLGTEGGLLRPESLERLAREGPPVSGGPPPPRSARPGPRRSPRAAG